MTSFYFQELKYFSLFLIHINLPLQMLQTFILRKLSNYFVRYLSFLKLLQLVSLWHYQVSHRILGETSPYSQISSQLSRVHRHSRCEICFMTEEAPAQKYHQLSSSLSSHDLSHCCGAWQNCICGRRVRACMLKVCTALSVCGEKLQLCLFCVHLQMSI